MSDVHVDAAAELVAPDRVTFASLPPPLARLVFLALPPDARGRACCVCRAWRNALAEPTLWTRLDMSDVSASEGDDVHAQQHARRCDHDEPGPPAAAKAEELVRRRWHRG